MPKKGKLYSKKVEKQFEKEYGAKKGKTIFGAVVGKQYRKAHHGKNWNQKRR